MAQMPLPMLGNQRQKKERSKIIDQLARAAAERAKMGRFAKTGAVRGSVRSNSPFGTGGRFGGMKGAPRPDFLGNRGIGRAGEMREVFGGRGSLNTAPLQNPTPLDSLGAPSDLPVAPGALGSGDPRFDPTAPTNLGGTTIEDYAAQRAAAGGTGASINLGTTADFSGVDALLGSNQTSPAGSNIGLVGGGLIPLGGGVYMDPATGQIMGQGLGNRGLSF